MVTARLPQEEIDRAVEALREGEVIAFPKNNRGVDLMTHSPVEVDFKLLREIYIQSTAKKG